ncbi:UNVERIFIED_CONTAM: hypothetical protein HDU68_007207 [Siphonaria sp. JEL0065]|nr:hypothetical protein HDU68_007207 [Siphonaria sp. JEL0065]
MKIDVGVTKHKQHPCYFVSVIREINIEEGNHMWTVSSYVTPDLETLTESVYDVFTESETGNITEKITEAVKEEGNRGMIIITETTGTDDPAETIIPLTKDDDQLILNGAEFILNRILSKKTDAKEIVAQKYFNKGLYKTYYTTEQIQPETTPLQTPNEGHTVQIESMTKITMSAEKERLNIVQSRRGSKIQAVKAVEETQAVGLGANDFDQSFNAIVNKAISRDDGLDQGGVGACLEYDMKATHLGICVHLQGSGGFFSMDWYAEKVGGSKKAATALPIEDHDSAQSIDFGGNIELISEFKQQKAEIKRSHAQFIKEHPELQEIMSDYVQLILLKKPTDVFAFTQSWLTKP